MHEIRSILAQGGKREIVANKKASGLDPSRGKGLAGIAIPRVESRKTNQRREDRFLDLADRAVIIFRRRRIEVALANVSSHGVMIESDIAPRIGERIDIRFGDCNRTQCRVRWANGRRIGLEFANETVLIAPAKIRDLIVGGRRDGEQPAKFEMKQDRPHRQSIFWKGTLYHADQSLEIRLRNISAQGAMLDCDEDLWIGTIVVLELAGGAANAVEGRVRWCRSGQIGVRFDHPFDLLALAGAKPEIDSKPATPHYLKPDYLSSEGSSCSPWYGRREGLRPEDL